MNYLFEYEPHDVICREGDTSSNLYYLQEGRLVACSVNGTEVKVIARIEPGEFLGELSFFDGKPRSTHVVALEKSKIIQIPKEELFSKFPDWYVKINQGLTKKIRLLDHVISQSRFKKSSNEAQKPLSIEEQRSILKSISN